MPKRSSAAKRNSSANGYLTMTELCQRLGISTRTLLRKEKNGEIPPLPRDPRNGYRRFTEEDVLRLRLILGR